MIGFEIGAVDITAVAVLIVATALASFIWKLWEPSDD